MSVHRSRKTTADFLPLLSLRVLLRAVPCSRVRPVGAPCCAPTLIGAPPPQTILLPPAFFVAKYNAACARANVRFRDPFGGQALSSPNGYAAHSAAGCARSAGGQSRRRKAGAAVRGLLFLLLAAFHETRAQRRRHLRREWLGVRASFVSAVGCRPSKTRAQRRRALRAVFAFGAARHPTCCVWGERGGA